MYRLIVVDDDVDAVNNIAKDFPWEQSGFTLVGSFQDGESALAWLKTHTVDLILCDIKMARMNGIKPVTFREMQKTIAAIRETIERERGVHLPADSAHSGEANSHSIADVKIDRIRRYVQDHYAGVTLRQLAEFMQMNTTYLSYYFKEKTGQKLFDYITEVRLNAGLEILKTDSYLNVAEVAQKVGYTNAISFSRSFKKQFGVSPSQVRRDFDSTEEKK